MLVPPRTEGAQSPPLVRSVPLSHALLLSKAHTLPRMEYRRSVVDVVIEFLTDSARDELIDTIVSTESQPVVAHGFENGRQRVKKEFRVYDAELFVCALRFKAALNYACWSAQHRGTAAVPDSLFKE